MKKALKGIKVGATPPFGILYKLPAFVDNVLANQSKLIINAGDYQNSLKITAVSLFKLDKTAVKGNFSQAKK
jgi:prolyl-tRNA editing enzyme YbaK/EbsC (Cys-tRNA(Pro) deacylase)